MATKLKNMHLTSVDLVRAGANQEADICLYKSADPLEAAEAPTEAETSILKRFLAWLRAEPTEPTVEPENPVEKADDQPDTATIYKSAITESLQSIAADESLTAEEKNSLIEKSIGQYHDAMVELLKSEEGYAFEDMEKSFDEEGAWEEEDPEDLEKSDRYDEIEEVNVGKANPYHAADGKFTTANGGGGAGAAMSPGEKSTAIANAAISQSKKETKSTMNKLKSGKMAPDKALDSINTTLINLQDTRSSLSFGAGKQRAALNTEIKRVEGIYETVYFGNY